MVYLFSRCDILTTHLAHSTPKGNCVEAFSKYGESLDVMRRVYGADHPSIADTLKSQANVHEMLGKYGIVYVCTFFYGISFTCMTGCVKFVSENKDS